MEKFVTYSKPINVIKLQNFNINKYSSYEKKLGSIEKKFWPFLETYGMGSFAYYSAIDRFISSLALYFSVRMALPCVEGGYHA